MVRNCPGLHRRGAVRPQTYNPGMDDIRQKARERAQQMNLSYAGALLPAEAHALMQAGAKLVDVRTKP